MNITFFLKGIIIGFSIAAPVGPIGVLCIHRTLTQGRLSGLVSGLGAATADMIYGFIAGFGLTFISSIFISQQIWLHLIGGVFLLYLGIKTFLATPAEQIASAKGNSLISTYASTFFLTLINPMTILYFAGIFAGLGIASASGNYVTAGALVLGVFMGSALWWLILSSSVSIFRGKLNPHGLQWINRISSLIILGFGLYAFLCLIR